MALQAASPAARVSSTIIRPSREATNLEGKCMTAIDVVVMAAGKGTRMKSRLPKVLHSLAGRAMLQHVMDTVHALAARHVVVLTGNGASEVEAAVSGWAKAAGQEPARFARQEPQLGTGLAVQQAMPLLPDDGLTLILN